MRIMYDEDTHFKHKGIGVGTLLCNEGEFTIKTGPKPNDQEDIL